ncbi:MAG: hypothetical protein MK033_06295 [Candidatus Caenarcaniphilales bacterium]|nr:hypothetical protein [Candidatus Caenarcaniphilales bacterium]
MNYSYNLIYDSKSLKLRIWALIISVLVGDYVSIIQSQELLGKSYAGLSDADLEKSLILVLDFEVDDDFEALDESYINSVSDKRIYKGKEAIKRCLILNSWVSKLFSKQLADS